MANLSLQRANREKNDEFYTQLADIEQELRHYKEHFKDKVVFCNCDDPFESNFVKYFAMNFNYLGLKKLIATCYDSSPIAFEQMSIFDEIAPVRFANKDRHAYKIEINEVVDYNNDGAIDLSDVRHLLLNKNNTLTLLQGNGDFRSQECIDLLQQADVVVTNPPFSLFREYVAQLVWYEKKFVIIGNQNAITYKEIFPLLQKNKIWLGYNNGAQQFQVPMSFERNNTFVKNGIKYAKFGNICWFTNLDIKKRHENLVLYKKYSPEEYPKYDNYDAINVDKVADIPCDYFPTSNCSGEMGVPITFLEKHNPEQFELRKFRKGNDEKDLTYTIEQSNISQTDRQTDPNYTIFQNHHSSQSVMESLEYQLPLLTSTTPNNLNSLEQPRAKAKDSRQDCGVNQVELPRQSLRDEENTSVCLLNSVCNGLMGVPITFLEKYNPEQFEILGLDDHRVAWRGRGPDLNGKALYRRIIIRRKIYEN